jgi:PIN domain nuclease of toxin-antitoxin system
VNLLLDTHVLLWWLSDDERLTRPMRQAIGDSNTAVVVSAASAWEMAIKAALGKLVAPEGLVAELERQGFDQISVTVDDAVHAGALPRHHNDPFDRMLIAQALRRGLTLVTADRHIAAYDVRLL